MYSCSPTLSQISLKNSFGKVVFQILAKIEMTRKKICYLATILKRYNISIFFCSCDFFIVHTYMVQISLQNSAGKVVFYGWVPRNLPPWALTGVKYLGHLSVNTTFEENEVTYITLGYIIFTNFLNKLYEESYFLVGIWEGYTRVMERLCDR